MQDSLSTEEQLDELAEAAKQAEMIVTERVNAIVEGAEREAELIRNDAASQAERTRRDAVESAGRLVERIRALEQPLDELVAGLQEHMERVSRELEDGRRAESRAGAAVGPRLVEAAPEEPQPAEPRLAEPRLAEPQLAEPAAAKPTKREGGRRGRKGKKGKGPFISTHGNCAVCQRSFMAGSEEALALSGWLVSGDVGLCPDCQSQGWQLPEGARLPFRRGES